MVMLDIFRGVVFWSGYVQDSGRRLVSLLTGSWDTVRKNIGTKKKNPAKAEHSHDIHLNRPRDERQWRHENKAITRHISQRLHWRVMLMNIT